MATYALGNLIIGARADKALKRIFNKMNADRARATVVQSAGSGYSIGNVLTPVEGTFTTPATFLVTGVNVSGGVTSVALVESVNAGGVYSAHPAQNNHTTTVAPSGGTGCVLSIAFFQDIPNLITGVGGILMNAVQSWAAQQDQEIVNIISSAIPTATDPQLTAIASGLNLTLPV